MQIKKLINYLHAVNNIKVKRDSLTYTELHSNNYIDCDDY